MQSLVCLLIYSLTLLPSVSIITSREVNTADLSSLISDLQKLESQALGGNGDFSKQFRVVVGSLNSLAGLQSMEIMGYGKESDIPQDVTIITYFLKTPILLNVFNFLPLADGSRELLGPDADIRLYSRNVLPELPPPIAVTA